jgi:hypothetical protein
MHIPVGKIILRPMDKKNEWQFIAIAHEPDGVQVISASKTFASDIDQLRYPAPGQEARAELEKLLDDLIGTGWEPYGAAPTWSWWEYNIHPDTEPDRTMIESSPGRAVARPYESEEDR